MRDRLIDLIYESDLMHDYGEVNLLNCTALADYLLEHGVIVPPCKVGDMIHAEYYGEIVNACVTEFGINSKGVVVKVYIDPDTYREYDAADVFASREEAVKALKGGEGK